MGLTEMRLSRIEIENFKGVGERQVIDLAPITLLFGPNSAGKSTILQALHYAREILERQNLDPDQTIAGGLIDLGGFKNLIHNHDLSKIMKIKLVVDLSDDQSSVHLPINSGQALSDPQFANLGLRYLVGENSDLKGNAVVQELGAEISLRWSEGLNAPYVSVISVEMDGKNIVSITSPPDEGRAQITDFNFSHPLLDQSIDADDITLEEDINRLETQDGVGSADIEGDPFQSPLGSEIWELSRELAVDSNINPDSEFRIAVKTAIGALPNIHETLQPDLRDPEPKKFELESNTPRVNGLKALLDEILVGPLRILRDCLTEMTYIGPLREIPPRAFRPQVSPDAARWAQGLAAWDLLHSDKSGKLTKNVNEWMDGENKLNLGYHFHKYQFKKIPIPSEMDQLLHGELWEDEPIWALQDLYKLTEIHTELTLRRSNTQTPLTPNDVGVGVSQIIPVIVGCLRDKDGILAIEQPELHIHPAIQVGVGDLFIHAVRPGELSFGTGKTLLIETHSEHIMLRLLRRVRETSEGDLPPGAPELRPHDVSVIYVENTPEEVCFRRLRVDSDGDFSDRWPHGFFEERAGELF